MTKRETELFHFSRWRAPRLRHFVAIRWNFKKKTFGHFLWRPRLRYAKGMPLDSSLNGLSGLIMVDRIAQWPYWSYQFNKEPS